MSDSEGNATFVASFDGNKPLSPHLQIYMDRLQRALLAHSIDGTYVRANYDMYEQDVHNKLPTNLFPYPLYIRY